MHRVISCVLIALLSFGLLVNEASAKRFGGGRSFGMQRSQSSLFSSNKAYKNTAPAGKNFNKSKWGGMLGGMLVGGLLASLFMGHGFASGVMSWLMLAVAAYFIINFLRRRMQPAMQNAQSQPFSQNPFTSAFKQQHYAASENPSSSAPNFDNDSFIRSAKVNFIRLQAAYDNKDLADLKAFTLPEVFAEIKMQLDERGSVTNHTEVINLEAKVLDVAKQSQSTVVSVHFTGSIKEEGMLSQLDEIWHFRQLDRTQEWLVGGIQQDVHQP